MTDEFSVLLTQPYSLGAAIKLCKLCDIREQQTTQLQAKLEQHLNGKEHVLRAFCTSLEPGYPPKLAINAASTFLELSTCENFKQDEWLSPTGKEVLELVYLRILKGKAPERAIVTQILNCVVRLPGLRTDLDLKTKWRACEPFFKHQLKSDNNNLTVQFFLNSFNATEEAVDEWLAASLNPDLSTRTQIRRRFCNPEFDASFFKSKTIQVQKAPPQQMVQMELKIDKPLHIGHAIAIACQTREHKFLRINHPLGGDANSEAFISNTKSIFSRYLGIEIEIRKASDYVFEEENLLEQSGDDFSVDEVTHILYPAKLKAESSSPVSSKIKHVEVSMNQETEFTCDQDTGLPLLLNLESRGYPKECINQLLQSCKKQLITGQIIIPSLTDCLYQHLDNYKPPSVMAVFTDSLLKIDIDIDIGDGSQGLPNEIFINRTNFTPVGNNWTIGLVDVKDKILKFKGNVSNDCSTIKAKLVPAGRVKQIQYIPWVNANNVETQELYQGEQTRKVYTNFKGPVSTDSSLFLLEGLGYFHLSNLKWHFVISQKPSTIRICNTVTQTSPECHNCCWPTPHEHELNAHWRTFANEVSEQLLAFSEDKRNTTKYSPEVIGTIANLARCFTLAHQRDYTAVQQTKTKADNIIASYQTVANLLSLSENVFYDHVLNEKGKSVWVPFFCSKKGNSISFLIPQTFSFFSCHQPRPLSILQRDFFRPCREPKDANSTIAEIKKKLRTVLEKRTQLLAQSHKKHESAVTFCKASIQRIENSINALQEDSWKVQDYAFTSYLACWASYVSRNLMRYGEKLQTESFVIRTCRIIVNGMKHRSKVNKSHESLYRYLVSHLQYCLMLARDNGLQLLGRDEDASPTEHKLLDLLQKLWNHKSNKLLSVLPTDTLDSDEFIVSLSQATYEKDDSLDTTAFRFSLHHKQQAAEAELVKLCKFSLDFADRPFPMF